MTKRPEIDRALERVTRYDEIRRTCEASVVAWKWTSDPPASYEPAYFELNDVRPGRETSEPASKSQSTYCYGVDDHERIVAVRNYTELPGRYYETFFVHQIDGIERFCYSYVPGKPYPSQRACAEHP